MRRLPCILTLALHKDLSGSHMTKSKHFHWVKLVRGKTILFVLPPNLTAIVLTVQPPKLMYNTLTWQQSALTVRPPNLTAIYYFLYYPELDSNQYLLCDPQTWHTISLSVLPRTWQQPVLTVRPPNLTQYITFCITPNLTAISTYCATPEADVWPPNLPPISTYCATPEADAAVVLGSAM